MAAKHRTLFPLLKTNQTVVCTYGNCDPTCRNGCYIYPPVDHLPPPEKHAVSISPYIIIAAALLASFLLLLGYYLIIVKNCSGWQRRRISDRRLDDVDAGDFVDRNSGTVVDHPVWYIRTVGLPPSVINKIKILDYEKGDNLIQGTECSVCLNEFQEFETIRILPKCNHPFHVHCIDTWLATHTNCPLCRDAIVSGGNFAAAAPNLQNPVANEAIPAEISAERSIEQSNSISENQENEVRIQEFDRGGVSGLRRSFSIDSSSIAANVLDLGIDLTKNSRIDRKMAAGDSIEESFRKRKILMKRSFSYGGMPFVSGPNPTPYSILPL